MSQERHVDSTDGYSDGTDGSGDLIESFKPSRRPLATTEGEAARQQESGLI